MADTVTGKYLELKPQSTSGTTATSATLVVSTESFSDVKFGAGFKTIEQLRSGVEANTWETAWAIFGYQDPSSFYYLALKTNGWELGKSDDSYPAGLAGGGQRFLATGDLPKLPVGEEHSFYIEQSGNAIKVYIDNQLVTSFTDNERPLLSGKVGFYTEDAKVAFDNVVGSITETFESYPVQQWTNEGHVLASKWETVYTGYGYGAIKDDGTTASVTAPVTAPTSTTPVAATPTSPTSTLAQATYTGTLNNDYIAGNEAANTINGLAGADNLNGNGGNDRITGGAGADAMAGGLGADTFLYNARTESTRGAADLIVDWQKGDKIDLSAIDAIAATSSNDVFAFIGNNVLTKAGQVTHGYDAAQNRTYIDARIDGNPVNDLHIELIGKHTFVANDFIL